mgnify:FL=1
MSRKIPALAVASIEVNDFTMTNDSTGAEVNFDTAVNLMDNVDVGNSVFVNSEQDVINESVIDNTYYYIYFPKHYG